MDKGYGRLLIIEGNSLSNPTQFEEVDLLVIIEVLGDEEAHIYILYLNYGDYQAGRFPEEKLPACHQGYEASCLKEGSLCNRRLKYHVLLLGENH